MHITTIGLDLAKSVFQAHGIDGTGNIVLVKKLHRKQMLPFFSKLPPCLIGVEACATAHHWARVLIAMGHEVRIMPPSYVKGYVKRGKSDALDAEAICEAVGRPTMRFVPVKSIEQQSILMAHRTRSLLVRQRTTVTDPDQFRSGRQFAAWLGLTPRQLSTGGKTRLGGISKQGDRYLRRLLVVGATAVMRYARQNPTPLTDWVNGLLERKPFRLVSVALANKLARIAWAVLTRGETYRPFRQPA